MTSKTYILGEHKRLWRRVHGHVDRVKHKVHNGFPNDTAAVKALFDLEQSMKVSGAPEYKAAINNARELYHEAYGEDE